MVFFSTMTICETLNWLGSWPIRKIDYKFVVVQLTIVLLYYFTSYKIVSTDLFRIFVVHYCIFTSEIQKIFIGNPFCSGVSRKFLIFLLCALGSVSFGSNVFFKRSPKACCFFSIFRHYLFSEWIIYFLQFVLRAFPLFYDKTIIK